MAKRTPFEWLMISVLAVLLIGAGIGFAFLLRQFYNPSSTNPPPAAITPELFSTAISADNTPASSQVVTKTLSFQTPPAEEPGENTPAPTRFAFQLTSARPGAIPSHFIFTRPLDSPDPFWPVAELRFGSGTNLSSTGNLHTGLDYLAEYGDAVHALGSGEVIWEGYGIESNLGPDNAYGIAVTIKHDELVNDLSVYSIYAHLSVTHVVEGDRVNEGDLIGEVGLSGNTSGSHLHLEVRLGDDSSFVTRNPELYIRPFQGCGVLAARLLNSDGSNLYSQEVILESLADHKKWNAYSYSSGAATQDYLLKENLVIGDLPAGQYAVTIFYGGAELHHSVIIRSGEITYFTFNGYAGYQDDFAVE